MSTTPGSPTEVIDLTKDPGPTEAGHRLDPEQTEPMLSSPTTASSSSSEDRRSGSEGTRSVVRKALTFAPPPLIFGAPIYTWAHEFLRAWANSSGEMATRPPVPPPKDVVAPRLFYRLYSESESIRSRHYVTPDDHSFARINADTIPPPHTAAALRRFLCSQEGFDPERSVLFLKRSDTEPAMDAEFISVLKGVGPGSSSDQPLALIVKVDKETPAPRFRIRAKEKWIAPKGYLSYEEGEVLLTDGIDDIHQGSIRMSFLHSWVTVLTTVIGLWKAQKSRGSGRIGLINPKRFEIL